MYSSSSGFKGHIEIHYLNTYPCPVLMFLHTDYCIPISIKLFSTLLVHLCFDLPSGLLPFGFHFKIVFIKLYWISIHQKRPAHMQYFSKSQYCFHNMSSFLYIYKNSILITSYFILFIDNTYSFLTYKGPRKNKKY